MFQLATIVVLLAAIFYLSPGEKARERRTPIPQCVEKASVRDNCLSGNALTFYDGPSAHTSALVTALRTLQVSANFIVETTSYTDWATVRQLAAYNFTSTQLT